MELIKKDNPKTEMVTSSIETEFKYEKSICLQPQTFNNITQPKIIFLEKNKYDVKHQVKP